MIRDVSLRGKFGWLLVLVHNRRLPARHLRTIFQICDLRNEFLHYKYKLVDVDITDEENDRFKLAHKLAEQTVRYLQKFEEQHFFKGAARGLLKKLRNTKHER